MDISSLLNDAANEALGDDYEDAFEEESPKKVEPKPPPLKPTNSGNGRSKLSILKECAETVAEEEKIASAEIFKEMAIDIVSATAPVDEDVKKLVVNIAKEEKRSLKLESANQYDEDDEDDEENDKEPAPKPNRLKFSLDDDSVEKADSDDESANNASDPLFFNLKIACFHGNRKNVISSLQSGANPHSRDQHGW